MAFIVCVSIKAVSVLTATPTPAGLACYSITDLPWPIRLVGWPFLFLYFSLQTCTCVRTHLTYSTAACVRDDECVVYLKFIALWADVETKRVGLGTSTPALR